MFIEVVKAEYLDGYRVKLLFNNGETKVVDLAQSLNGSVFAPLKDIDFFKNFSIKFYTIEWENFEQRIYVFSNEIEIIHCITISAFRSSHKCPEQILPHI